MGRFLSHSLAGLAVVGLLLVFRPAAGQVVPSPPAAGGTAEPGTPAVPPAVQAGRTASPPAAPLPLPTPAAGNSAAPPAAAPPPRLAGVLAGKQPIKITVDIDRAVIRVGDLVHYSLLISAAPGSKIIMPPPGAQLGLFLIRDYHFPGMEEKEQKWSEDPWGYLRRKLRPASKKEGEQAFHFTITAYETGDLVIPPLPVMVIDAGGGQHALFAESARIRVVAVTSPEDLTIKDVKPPLENPVPAAAYLPYLAAPLLLAAAVVLGWRLWKRRRKEETGLLALRPAHEIAEEELRALEQEGLLEAGEYEKFYTRLSWILRKYLALRFSIYALEYTTPEILERLKTADLELADFERIRRFLEAADQVKFACHTPGLEERNAVLPEAREIVARTKIEPPAETAKEAA